MKNLIKPFLFTISLVILVAVLAPVGVASPEWQAGVQKIENAIIKKLTVGAGGFTSQSAATFQNGVTVSAGGQTITAGGQTITAGGLTVTAGGVTTSDGNIVTADFARITAQTSLTVTDSTPFTPTGTYQPITSSGSVTPTISTTGYTAGDTVMIVNNSNTSILIQDTGNQVLASSYTMGQYDTLTIRFDGTRWIELGRSNN